MSLLSLSKASCGSGHFFHVFAQRPSWLPGTAVMPSHCGPQTPPLVCPRSAPYPLSPVRHELSCFRFCSTCSSVPSPSPNRAHRSQPGPVCTSLPSITFLFQVCVFPLRSLLAVNIGEPQEESAKIVHCPRDTHQNSGFVLIY